MEEAQYQNSHLGFGPGRVMWCAEFNLTLCNDGNNLSFLVWFGFGFVCFFFKFDHHKIFFQARFLIQLDLERFGKSRFLRPPIWRAAMWFSSANTASEPQRFFSAWVHEEILNLFTMDLHCYSHPSITRDDDTAQRICSIEWAPFSPAQLSIPSASFITRPVVSRVEHAAIPSC